MVLNKELTLINPMHLGPYWEKITQLENKIHSLLWNPQNSLACYNNLRLGPNFTVS
jgi:hypothetical protein